MRQIEPEFIETLRRDGVAMAPQLLDDSELALLFECFEWTVANPGPLAIEESKVDSIYRIDNDNPKALEAYSKAVSEVPFGKIMAEVWQSENVWFFAEEMFWKKGKADRTFWHQDTSYSPLFGGTDWVNVWISFDKIAKKDSLEVVRGTHVGPIYDGTSFDWNDPTAPLWGDKIDPPLPRLPDIEKDRVENPGKWDVASWDIDPGDVIFLHPNSLHGGAPGTEEGRRTIVLRYFGDGAIWTRIPSNGIHDQDLIEQTRMGGKHHEPGTPFRPANRQKVV